MRKLTLLICLIATAVVALAQEPSKPVDNNQVIGVMGIQDKADVELIRHAYDAGGKS